jgi:CcmD family protein
MTIHPVLSSPPARPHDALPHDALPRDALPRDAAPQDAPPDTGRADPAPADTARTDTAPTDTLPSTAYDTVWAGEAPTTTQEEIPTKQREGLERVMLADGKIYVVLAVVLVIWFGLLYYLFRTDRRLDRLERQVEADISDDQYS